MRTIAEQFKYWQEALDDFQKNVEKDLDEIRRYKSEVQQMKIDLIDHLEKGRYVMSATTSASSSPLRKSSLVMSIRAERYAAAIPGLFYAEQTSLWTALAQVLLV